MALNVVHQSMTYCRNFGKNEEICDINRFACQWVNYEIGHILLVTYNDQMKFSLQTNSS